MVGVNKHNNMTFNKEEHIARMKPAADKLVSQLKKVGIEFSPTDDFGWNVVLTSKDKVVKISHHSFYRISGMACMYKDGGEKNSVETIELTDEMFMTSLMRSNIDMLFNPKTKI